MDDYYVRQPDANTCQSACIANVLRTQDVKGIRQALLSMGVPGDPVVMGEYLKPRVKEYRFNPFSSLNECRALLDKDYELITHGYFTGSGHVVCLKGFNQEGFVVDDPWGEIDFKSFTYINDDGDDITYSYRAIYATCVVGHSFREAIALYNSGIKPDMDFKNAWVHAVMR